MSTSEPHGYVPDLEANGWPCRVCGGGRHDQAHNVEEMINAAMVWLNGWQERLEVIGVPWSVALTRVLPTAGALEASRVDFERASRKGWGQ